MSRSDYLAARQALEDAAVETCQLIDTGHNALRALVPLAHAARQYADVRAELPTTLCTSCGQRPIAAQERNSAAYARNECEACGAH